MITYHFCAMRQQLDNSIFYFDGLVDANNPVTTKKGYDLLKDIIASQIQGANTGKDIILISFSAVN